MGMKLIFGLIFLVTFLSVGIAFFINSRKKKSKIDLIISIVMLLSVVLVVLTNTIDEFSISKKDVISDLKYLNFDLKDDFTITKSNVTVMPERIQKTKIKITQEDKNRIIKEIRSSKNFKSFANAQEIANDIDVEQFGATNKVFNFKYPEFYSRETYTEINNYPARLFISINDKTNILEYQKIED